MMVRADSELHRQLKMVAQATGGRLNSIVVGYLKREVANDLPQIQRAKPTPEPAPRKASRRAAG